MNNVTVNALSATLNPANPKPATITIIGANNNDVINLGSGNDLVTVGGPMEVVHGGSGINQVNVTAATIGATIDGGSSGQNQLVVSGGGLVAMGASVTDFAFVSLAPGTTGYTFTANGISGLTVNDLSTKASTITAGGPGQILMGGAAGLETMVGFGSGVTTYKNTGAKMNGDTIRNFATTDHIDFSDIAFGAGTTVAFTPASSTQGTLSISVNGVQKAQVTLFGQLMAANFNAQDDGFGGTIVSEPPAMTHLVLASPTGA